MAWLVIHNDAIFNVAVLISDYILIKILINIIGIL